MSQRENTKLGEIVEREAQRVFPLIERCSCGADFDGYGRHQSGCRWVESMIRSRRIYGNAVAKAVVEEMKTTIQRGTISGLCASGWLIAELDALTGPNSERCSHGVWGGDHCWKCDDGQREDERR